MKMTNVNMKPLGVSAAIASVFAAGSAQGAIYANTTGKWEVPANWDTGIVPGDASRVGETPSVPANQSIVIYNDSQVTFDAATWTYLQTNSLLFSATEYRGAARLLMGESTSGGTNGTHSLTFNQGGTNLVNMTNSSNQAAGSRDGKNSTLNVQSGILNLGGAFTLGGQATGSGTLNLSGGQFINGRGDMTIGVTTGGTGLLNITGGDFTNRQGVIVNASGVFSVSGSAATRIGIGSEGSLDGFFTLATGGTLAMGIDSNGTGVRNLFVDDVGTGASAATFAAGSILDMSFFGTAPRAGTWTLLELKNKAIVDNGLTLATGDAAAGWSFAVTKPGANGLLTATFIPEPSSFALALGGLGLLVLRRRRA